jgi:toxin ParE1/3/4
MKVRLTGDARGDLRQIKAYISARDALAAERVIDQIRRTLTLLTVLPRLGHPGVVEGTYEKGVPLLPYLIIYRIDVAGITSELIVLRVYHTARDR